MVTNRKAPIEVLERLAEAVDREFRDGHATADVRAALSAYRAATAPLRTRAEVDEEIVALVRERRTYGFSSMHLDKLRVLCSEPTADDKEPK